MIPQNADIPSAKALIAFDADINKFNSSNETPYDIAVQKCPAIADILVGIGGMDAYQILADLQIHGSLNDHVDVGAGKEPSFDRLLDPAVMSMDHQDMHSDGGGDGTEGKGEGQALEGCKMSDIPEGVYVHMYILDQSDS